MYANLDNLNIKTKIGGLIFDIILDKRFFTPDMDNVVQKHKHSLYEFHYIVEGEGIVYINNSQYKVYPGCYFIVNSGVYHKQLQDNSNPIHKHCFKFEYKYYSHMVDSFFPEEESKRISDILNQLDYFICENSSNSGTILSFIHEIQEELASQKIGFYARIQCLFTQLYILVIRDITLDKGTSYSIPQKLPYEKRSALIENFFDTHFNDNVTSNDLCEILNLSISQLNRILKKKYNSTFRQKLLEMRIEAAKRYLESTNFSIVSIAEKVGYSTSSHFCNIFKDKCGMTPSKYRELIRKYFKQQLNIHN